MLHNNLGYLFFSLLNYCAEFYVKICLENFYYNVKKLFLQSKGNIWHSYALKRLKNQGKTSLEGPPLDNFE